MRRRKKRGKGKKKLRLARKRVLRSNRIARLERRYDGSRILEALTPPPPSPPLVSDSREYDPFSPINYHLLALPAEVIAYISNFLPSVTDVFALMCSSSAIRNGVFLDPEFGSYCCQLLEFTLDVAAFFSSSSSRVFPQLGLPYVHRLVVDWAMQPAAFQKLFPPNINITSAEEEDDDDDDDHTYHTATPDTPTAVFPRVVVVFPNLCAISFVDRFRFSSRQRWYIADGRRIRAADPLPFSYSVGVRTEGETEEEEGGEREEEEEGEDDALLMTRNRRKKRILKYENERRGKIVTSLLSAAAVTELSIAGIPLRHAKRRNRSWWWKCLRASSSLKKQSCLSSLRTFRIQGSSYRQPTEVWKRDKKTENGSFVLTQGLVNAGGGRFGRPRVSALESIPTLLMGSSSSSSLGPNLTVIDAKNWATLQEPELAQLLKSCVNLRRLGVYMSYGYVLDPSDRTLLSRLGGPHEKLAELWWRDKRELRSADVLRFLFELFPGLEGLNLCQLLRFDPTSWTFPNVPPELSRLKLDLEVDFALGLSTASVLGEVLNAFPRLEKLKLLMGHGRYRHERQLVKSELSSPENVQFPRLKSLSLKQGSTCGGFLYPCGGDSLLRCDSLLWLMKTLPNLSDLFFPPHPDAPSSPLGLLHEQTFASLTRLFIKGFEHQESCIPKNGERIEFAVSWEHFVSLFDAIPCISGLRVYQTRLTHFTRKILPAVHEFLRKLRITRCEFHEKAVAYLINASPRADKIKLSAFNFDDRRLAKSLKPHTSARLFSFSCPTPKSIDIATVLRKFPSLRVFRTCGGILSPALLRELPQQQEYLSSIPLEDITVDDLGMKGFCALVTLFGRTLRRFCGDGWDQITLVDDENGSFPPSPTLTKFSVVGSARKDEFDLVALVRSLLEAYPRLHVLEMEFMRFECTKGERVEFERRLDSLVKGRDQFLSTVIDIEVRSPRGDDSSEEESSSSEEEEEEQEGEGVS